MRLLVCPLFAFGFGKSLRIKQLRRIHRCLLEMRVYGWRLGVVVVRWSGRIGERGRYGREDCTHFEAFRQNARRKWIKHTTGRYIHWFGDGLDDCMCEVVVAGVADEMQRAAGT